MSDHAGRILFVDDGDQLTLLVGQYAQRFGLGKAFGPRAGPKEIVSAFGRRGTK